MAASARHIEISLRKQHITSAASNSNAATRATRAYRLFIVSRHQTRFIAYIAWLLQQT